MFNKNFLFAVLIAAIIGIALSYALLSSDEEPSSTLVVGLQSGYPPFEFMNIDGKIVGFDVDTAQEIAEQMGKKLVLKDMEFEGLILALKQGKIDLIMSGMNITPSRMKEIALVPYHGEALTHLSLIFWNTIPENVHSLQDLAQLKNGSVSVESGSISEIFLSRYPQVAAKPFPGALAPLMDVKWGKSTANLVEPGVAQYLKNQHPEIQILDIPLSKEDGILGFGIGIKKENQELYETVSEIIQKMKASGQLQKLENQWFVEGGESCSTHP
jgi:arginine transport system substrate-binding protein